MKAERTGILVHPVFIVSLLLLVLNDNYLKEEYHNALTGKLSDAAGLILLSLALTLFITRNLLIVLFCAVFFTWWKTSLSTPVINQISDLFNVQVHRQIDYTDLFTLPVVFIVYLVKPMRLHLSEPIKNIGSYASACFCLFAFCRTSTMRPQFNLRDHEVRFDKYYDSKLSEEEILDKLRRMNLTVSLDSIRYYPIRKDELYFYDSSSSSMQLFQWPHNNKDSGLYERRVKSFYSIAEFTVNNETLTNIEFTIYPRRDDGSKTKVHVESYQSRRTPMAYDRESQKQTNLVRKELKKLFKE